MKGRALLFAAGFAAGVVVGVLIGGALAPVAETATPTGNEADATEATPPTPPRSGGRHRTGSDATDEPGPGGDPVALAVAGTDVDLPAAGTGRVTGTVRTPAGDPVAGARVSAYAPLPDELSNDYEDQDVDLVVRTRRFLRAHAWRAAARRATVTGPDGKYVLDRLLDRNYWIGARAEGYEIETAPDSDEEARDGDVVDFVAEARVAVEFRVEFPDGTDAGPTTVRFKGPGGAHHASWPDARRVYLQEGPHDVHATPDDQLWRAELLGVKVTREGVEPLVLRLRPRTGLSGQLVFEDGVHRERARIRLTALPSGAEPSPALFQGRYEAHSTTHGDDYRFDVFDLAPGEYVVAVEGLGRIGFDGMWTVTLGDRLVERVFEVAAPDPSRFVEVRVFGPDGRPLQDDLRVTLKLSADRWVGARQDEVLRRPDGALWLARMDAQQRRFPDARYSVTAVHERHGAIRVDLASPDAGAEIHFRPAAVTRVTVRGLEGSGLHGEVGVLLRPVSPGYVRLPSSGKKPGIDGVVVLAGVQPGEYDILLALPHNHLPARPVARRRTTLEPGDNVVTLTAPALHRLLLDVGATGRPWTLRATSAAGLLERLGRFFVDARPDALGRAEFERLPAGEYDVRAWGKGAPETPKRVVVPAEGPVKW